MRLGLRRRLLGYVWLLHLAVFALVLCALFAVIDESLQNFIPGRTGSLADVIVDISGAVLAYFSYLAISFLLRMWKYLLHV